MMPKSNALEPYARSVALKAFGFNGHPIAPGESFEARESTIAALATRGLVIPVDAGGRVKREWSTAPAAPDWIRLYSGVL